jgi:hypothetical protein
MENNMPYFRLFNLYVTGCFWIRRRGREKELEEIAMLPRLEKENSEFRTEKSFVIKLIYSSRSIFYSGEFVAKVPGTFENQPQQS